MKKKIYIYHILLFLFLWLMVGLSTGLSTIIGPIHWAANFTQWFDFDQWVEDTLAKIIIALYVLVTAFIALWLWRTYFNTKFLHIKISIILLCTAFGAGAAWLLLHPASLSVAKSNINIYNARLTFGSFPDKELLKDLKKQGYTVISLLNPAKFPIDKFLLEQEEKNAVEVGIEVINLPMLPWLASEENKEITNKIMHLLQNTKKRYYVHCYLGMDRIRLVMRVIEKKFPSYKMLVMSSLRSIFGKRKSSPNGPIISLSDGVYLGPKIPLDPNEETKFLFSYIVDANIKSTVIIFDPLDEQEQAWNKEQIKWFNTYAIPIKSYAVSTIKFDPERILAIVRQIKEMPRPIYINTYSVSSALADAITQAFRSDLPPLSQYLFLEPLKGGKINVIAPNVAIGPRPFQDEWVSKLSGKGISQFIYIGNVKDKAAVEDDERARVAGLNWVVMSPESVDIRKLTKKNSTWYFYGPGLNYANIVGIDHIENGVVRELDLETFLTPFPNSQELSKYWLDGYVKQVLVITENETEKKLLKSEQQILNDHGVAFEQITLPSEYDPLFILNLARKVWNLPHPIIVQYSDPNSISAQAFIAAFFTNVPPLNRTINDFTLENGAINLLTTNIASGPTPSTAEFKELYNNGVRVFNYFGPPSTIEYMEGRKNAIALRADWTSTDPTLNTFYRSISTGGPWYIYGPGLNEVYNQTIRDLFGPYTPSIITNYPENKLKTYFDELNQNAFEQNNWIYCDNCVGYLFPDWGKIALFSPLFALYTLLCASLVGWLRTEKQVRVGYTRKFFHLLIFTMAGVIQIIWYLPLVMLFGVIVSIAVMYAVLRGAGFAFYEAMARPQDEPKRSSFIIIPLIMTAVGGYLGNIWFGGFAAVGIILCGWGDAVGELIGSRWGKHQYSVPSLFGVPAVRSLEGSTAIFLVSILVCIPILLILGLPPTTALWISLITGLIGTIVEALSYHGLDNLTVQLSTTAAAYYLTLWSGITG